MRSRGGIVLAFTSRVKTTIKTLVILVIGAAIAAVTSSVTAQQSVVNEQPHVTRWQQGATKQQHTAAQHNAQYKPIADAFEKRVKDYVKVREDLEAKMPKLSKEAKPEEIELHKKQLQESVRAARTGAKHGDIFTPDAAAMIKNIIKEEFKGRDKMELRKTVLVESEVKAVPLRVNYPYPETKEQLEMPPTLLLTLPQLPKQIRYRFVGRNLLLVDRENGLILDYMTDALP